MKFRATKDYARTLLVKAYTMSFLLVDLMVALLWSELGIKLDLFGLVMTWPAVWGLELMSTVKTVPLAFKSVDELI